MKKILMTWVLCMMGCIYGFSIDDTSSWEGIWEFEKTDFSINSKLPFHSELSNDVITIYNDSPDRDIYCEIINASGVVVQSWEISQENSARIILPVAELPGDASYTIVLTSPNPTDRVYSTFEK